MHSRSADVPRPPLGPQTADGARRPLPNSRSLAERLKQDGEAAARPKPDVRQGRPVTDRGTDRAEAQAVRSERPAGVEDRPTPIDPVLKRELLETVPPTERHFLEALLRQLERRGVRLEYAKDGLGYSHKVAGKGTICCDRSALRAEPEMAVWKLYDEYQHLIRPLISPQNFASAKAYAAAMLREEFEVAVRVIEKKVAHEEKLGIQRSTPKLLLEAEYRAERARQRERFQEIGPGSERYRRVRDETREALWQKIKDESPEVPQFTSGRILPGGRHLSYKEHYERVYELYHSLPEGERERAIEHLTTRAPGERDLPEDVQWCIQDMLAEGKLLPREVRIIEERWQTINQKASYISGITHELFLGNMRPEKLVEFLSGKMTAYEVYAAPLEELLERVPTRLPERFRDIVLEDLLPHIAGGPIQSAEDILQMRQGWHRMVYGHAACKGARDNCRHDRWEHPRISIWHEGESVAREVLSMKPVDLKAALLGSEKFQPVLVNIKPYAPGVAGAEEVPLSWEAEEFLLKTTRPVEDVAYYMYMEQRMRHDVHGLPEDTRKIVEGLIPTLRWELLQGQVRSDMLRLIFPNARDVEGMRDHQWQLTKFLIDGSLEGQQGELQRFIQETEHVRDEMDQTWDRLLGKVREAGLEKTEQRLLEMERDRPLAAHILKFQLLVLSHIGNEELTDFERTAFANTMKLMIWHDFCKIMPMVVPEPVERDYSRAEAPKARVATPRQIVHYWMKDAHPENSFVLMPDLGSGIPIPSNRNKALLIGRIGEGRFRVMVYNWIEQFVYSRQSVIVADVKSGERDFSLLETMGGPLDATKRVAVISPKEGHYNILDTIMYYDVDRLEGVRRYLAEMHGRLSPNDPLYQERTELEARKRMQIVDAKDFAIAWTSRAVSSKVWDDGNARVPGVRELAEQYLTSIVLHLRTTHPDAKFSDFVKLVEKSHFDIRKEIFAGKSEEARKMIRSLGKTPARDREYVLSILRTSVAPTHADYIERMGAKSDFTIPELIDGNMAVYVQVPLDGNIVPEKAPYEAVLLHRLQRAVVTEQELRKELHRPEGEHVHTITTGGALGQRLVELYYRAPGDCYLTLILTGLEEFPKSLHDKSHYIYAAGMDHEAGKRISEYTGDNVVMLSTFTQTQQLAHTSNKGTNLSNWGWVATHIQNASDAVTEGAQNAQREVNMRIVRTDELMQITEERDLLALFSLKRPLIIGEPDNWAKSIVYQALRKMYERRGIELQRGSVPGPEDLTFETPNGASKRPLDREERLAMVRTRLAEINQELDALADEMLRYPDPESSAAFNEALELRRQECKGLQAIWRRYATQKDGEFPIEEAGWLGDNSEVTGIRG